MSRYDSRFSNVGDGVIALVDGIAKVFLVVGGLAALLGIGFMLYSFFGAATGSPDQIANMAKYIDLFRNAGIFGLLFACIGGGWLLWGEETAGPIMIIVGLALVFSPAYLTPSGQSVEYQTQILENLRTSGIPATIIGFFLIIGDVVGRMKVRVKQGAKAETMKYGKDVKEERDVRNVFLGKCWQLPYCRKFVRERCPIYHAKRTCWKERVGCMCEESVIKNAMEGRTIPADVVAASKFIPKNNKLTPSQKAERCRQCVIYNEHQKHKYKLAIPVAFLTVAGIYLGLRVPLGNAILGMLNRADEFGKDVGLTGPNEATEVTKVTALEGGVIPYHEIILFVLALVILAYAIKLVEFMFFRVKV